MYLGAILDEVGLHQLTKRIPSSIKPKGFGSFEFSQSRDPTLMAPKNTIQADDTEYLMFESQEKIEPIRNAGSMDKMGFPQATKSIYQALKRGLRRLSGVRRNNSA